MELSLIILIVAVVALNAFALWYGADSTDGDSWTNHNAV